MSKEKLAYPIYHTYTLEEAKNFKSVFLNLFSTTFKRQKSLIFNKSCYFNNVECLVVDKAFIFIWSWEIDLSYLVDLDRVLKNALVILTKKTTYLYVFSIQTETEFFFWKPIFILTWMNPQNPDIHVEALKLIWSSSSDPKKHWICLFYITI